MRDQSEGGKMEKISLETFESFLASISYGEPQTYGKVVIFPLYSNMTTEDSYMLSKEAYETDKLIIEEISEGGTVPNIKVKNYLDSDVIFFEGEVLIGAKQNRTLNSTIIIGKNKEVIIPVSCVESGRWSYYRNRSFRSSDYYADPELRRLKSKSVSDSLKRNRTYRSDQSGIWNDISDKMRRYGVHSPSESLSDVYESREKIFERKRISFTCDDNQIGIAVFKNGKFSGCDIMGVKGIFPKVFSKVIKSYIYIDHYSSKEDTMENSKMLGERLEMLFKNIMNIQKDTFKSAGEGYDIRFEDNQITGFAIIHKENIVHLAGFGLY